MSLLLLGASGFIGQQIGIDCNGLNIEYVGLSSADIDLLEHDAAARLAALINSDTSMIICSGIKRQMGDSYENWKKNEAITKALGDAVRLSRPKHITYLSSTAVYGEDVDFDAPITEKTPLMCRSYYGLSKYTAEAILRLVADEEGIPLAVLRAPLLYGAGDHSVGYGPTMFADKALRNEQITLWGDGSEFREFLWIGDVGRLAIEASAYQLNATLNLASGTSYTFQQVLDEVATALGRPLDVVCRPRSKSKTDHYFDNAQLMSLLPEFNFTDLGDGVNWLIETLKERASNAV